MLMNDFKKGSEPQYAAGKQVKKGADLTGCLVVGNLMLKVVRVYTIICFFLRRGRHIVR